jgi:hypothetical protein
MRPYPINKDLLAKIIMRQKHKSGVLTKVVPTVKDIVVVQCVSPPKKTHSLGEFDFDKNAVTPDKADICNETEQALVKRMIGTIERIILQALAIHIEDNFYPGNIIYSFVVHKKKLLNKELYCQEFKDLLNKHHKNLRLKKEQINHITRLSFHEFSFYAHQDRGPLTLLGLQQLIDGLEAFIKILPPNMHLLLGSFPFSNNKPENAKQQVHNIAIYVQCGSQYKIELFTKAFPHSSDPRYPNTSNARFSDPSLASYIDTQIAKASLANDGLLQLEQGYNLNVSGNFTCETEGNIRFQTFVELCMDHIVAVAKQQLKEEIASCLEHVDKFEQLPVTHIIMSNTTDPDQNNLVSTSYIQADPNILNAKTGDYTIINLNYLTFGKDTKLYVHKTTSLGIYSKAILSPFTKQLDLITSIQSLQMYRTQRPYHSSLIHKMIKQKIKNHLVCELEQSIKDIICLPGKTLGVLKQIEILTAADYLLEKDDCSQFLIDLFQLKTLFLKRASSGEIKKIIRLITLTQKLLQEEIRPYLRKMTTVELILNQAKNWFRLAILCEDNESINNLLTRYPQLAYEDISVLNLMVSHELIHVLRCIITKTGKDFYLGSNALNHFISVLHLADIKFNNKNNYYIFKSIWTELFIAGLAQLSPSPQLQHRSFEVIIYLIQCNIPRITTRITNSLNHLIKNYNLIGEIDLQGNTLLHIAIKKRNLAFTELLIRNGAVLSAKNHAGQSCYDLSTMYTDHLIFEQVYPAAEVEHKEHYASDFIAAYLQQYPTYIPGVMSVIKSNKEAVVRLLKHSDKIQLLECSFDSEVYQEVLNHFNAATLSKIIKKMNCREALINEINEKCFKSLTSSTRTLLATDTAQMIIKRFQFEADTISAIQKLDKIFIPDSNIDKKTKLIVRVHCLLVLLQNRGSYSYETYGLDIKAYFQDVLILLKSHPNYLLEKDMPAKILNLVNIFCLYKLGQVDYVQDILNLVAKTVLLPIDIKDQHRLKEINNIIKALVNPMFVASFQRPEYFDTRVIDFIFTHVPCMITYQDDEGNTQLQYAILQKNEKYVRYLLTLKQDLSVINHDNKTPYDLVISAGFSQVFPLFYSAHPQPIEFAIAYMSQSSNRLWNILNSIIDTIKQDIPKIIESMPFESCIELLNCALDSELQTPALMRCIQEDFRSTIPKLKRFEFLKYLSIFTLLALPNDLQHALARQAMNCLTKFFYGYDSTLDKLKFTLFIHIPDVDLTPLLNHCVEILATNKTNLKKDSCADILDIMIKIILSGQFKLTVDSQKALLNLLVELFKFLPWNFTLIYDIADSLHFLEVDNETISPVFKQYLGALEQFILKDIEEHIKFKPNDWNLFFAKKGKHAHVINVISYLIKQSQSPDDRTKACEKIAELVSNDTKCFNWIAKKINVLQSVKGLCFAVSEMKYRNSMGTWVG